MAERYSSGFNAQIFLLDQSEKLLFPRADLVRRDTCEDPYWFMRSYYRHQIASTLWPSNFITVTAVRRSSLILENNSNSHIVYPENSYTMETFSKMASVLPDHAVFSDRMELSEKGKKSACVCRDCFLHRRFHVNNGVNIKAKKLADTMMPKGITPAYDDSSDYCMDDRDNIVFFEIDFLESGKVIKAVDYMKLKSGVKQQVTQYIARFDYWLQKSRNQCKTGSSVLRVG